MKKYQEPTLSIFRFDEVLTQDVISTSGPISPEHEKTTNFSDGWFTNN